MDDCGESNHHHYRNHRRIRFCTAYHSGGEFHKSFTLIIAEKAVVKQPAVGRDGSHTSAVRFRSPQQQQAFFDIFT
jgi:hypothetical protein